MRRSLLSLAVLLFLSGCTAGPLSDYLNPADQRLFIQGMAEFPAEEERPVAFSTLEQQHPQSFWTRKVQELERLLLLIEEQQQEIRRLERSLAANRRQNQKQEHQIESLQKDLQGLETERKKLRQLLIDMEQRDL